MPCSRSQPDSSRSCCAPLVPVLCPRIARGQRKAGPASSLPLPCCHQIPYAVDAGGSAEMTRNSASKRRAGWTRGSDLLDLTGKLGIKLRDLRLARGISLKEASDLTGVPQPTLSRIENNKMAPTIGLLSKIVGGMDAPWSAVLPDFIISEAPAGQDISFSSASIPEVRLGRRKAQALHPHNPLSSKLRSFILSTQHRTVKEGGGFLSHSHTELCFVLEGVLRLHLK